MKAPNAALGAYVRRLITAGLDPAAKKAWDVYSAAKQTIDYAEWADKVRREGPKFEKRLKQILPAL